jgi:general secretion pathway protein J
MKNWRMPLPGENGFSLLEALLAIALMGLLLATLGTVTAQWMQSWRTGFERTQGNDLLGLAIDRIVADVGAAEFVSPSGENARPLFQGTASSVTFVRSAIGPNAPVGLEVVRLAETDDARGRVLVRSRATFTLAVTAEAIDAGAVEFTNPIVLVRPPFRVSFAFAGSDRVWQEAWQYDKQLPNAIRITVRDAVTDELLPASTAALLNVNAPAECVMSASLACGGQQRGGVPGERAAAQGFGQGQQPSNTQQPGSYDR